MDLEVKEPVGQGGGRRGSLVVKPLCLPTQEQKALLMALCDGALSALGYPWRSLATKQIKVTHSSQILFILFVFEFRSLA